MRATARNQQLSGFKGEGYIDLFRNLLRDADPALPGARNPHVLTRTLRLLCAGRLDFT